MNVLNFDWLYKKPYDYELKRYVFLDALNKYKAQISKNNLFTTLIEIETHLGHLYKFKYECNEILEKSKNIIGINLDIMDLEYSYNKDDVGLSEVCDFAIDSLEALHKDIRQIWINFSKNIKLTEIPEKNPTRKQGYLFMIHNDEIILYSYKLISMEWRDLEMIEENRFENTIDNIKNFIDDVNRVSSKNRFWRCDIKGKAKEAPYYDTLIHVAKYNLFNSIKLN